VIDHAPGAAFMACSRFVFEPGLPDTDRAAGPGAFAGPVWRGGGNLRREVPTVAIRNAAPTTAP